MAMQQILIVEDDPSLCQALGDTLRFAGFEVCAVATGHKALRQLAVQEYHVVVSDVQMPGMDGLELLQAIKLRYPHVPVILITAYASVQKAVRAIRQGALDYLVKPFDLQTLIDKIERLTDGQDSADARAPLAVDARSLRTLALARQVAATPASVLLSGESGVGKEVWAQYIHAQSARKKGPFVAINCAAIPDNMLEATLFGYEKGAFTGAYQAHAGKFEQAEGGTLLLDEISEMALGLQAKLLRVLQEREVERLGGRKTLALDVRILASCNRSLKTEVQAGRFRQDLFYRLNVFPLHIDPLRERSADIMPLVQRIVAKSARALGREIPSFSEAAKARLLAFAWPGNVRELDNVLQRAMILQPGSLLEAEHIQFEAELIADSGLSLVKVQPTTAPKRGLKHQENNLILDVLRTCMGSRKLAAEKLGISARTLRYKLAKLRDLGVDVPDF